jgi:hypothetical protein
MERVTVSVPAPSPFKILNPAAFDGRLESVGGSFSPSIGWVRDRYIEPVKMSFGGGSFEAARADGRAMPLVQAIALARQQALLLG